MAMAAAKSSQTLSHTMFMSNIHIVYSGDGQTFFPFIVTICFLLLLFYIRFLLSSDNFKVPLEWTEPFIFIKLFFVIYCFSNTSPRVCYMAQYPSLTHSLFIHLHVHSSNRYYHQTPSIQIQTQSLSLLLHIPSF